MKIEIEKRSNDATITNPIKTNLLTNLLIDKTMPNWCWTSYVAVGDKKDITQTYTKR